MVSVTAFGRVPPGKMVHRSGAKAGERVMVTGTNGDAALGLAIGLPIALLCVRFVQAQLYEIKHVDAAVLLGSILTLALAAAVAGLIPARRAASIDPAKALRTE